MLLSRGIEGVSKVKKSVSKLLSSFTQACELRNNLEALVRQREIDMGLFKGHRKMFVRDLASVKKDFHDAKVQNAPLQWSCRNVNDKFKAL